MSDQDKDQKAEQQPTPPQPSQDPAADLDLDLIKPDKKVVRLGGKPRDVHQPSMKVIVTLSKLARDFSDETKTTEQKMEIFDELKKVLSGIMPDFKDDDVDINIEQMIALLEFVFSMITPDDKEQLAKMANLPSNDPTTQKKTE